MLCQIHALYERRDKYVCVIEKRGNGSYSTANAQKNSPCTFLSITFTKHKTFFFDISQILQHRLLRLMRPQLPQSLQLLRKRTQQTICITLTTVVKVKEPTQMIQLGFINRNPLRHTFAAVRMMLPHVLQLVIVRTQVIQSIIVMLKKNVSRMGCDFVQKMSF